jgi:hypothetical protein
MRLQRIIRATGLPVLAAIVAAMLACPLAVRRSVIADCRLPSRF